MGDDRKPNKDDFLQYIFAGGAVGLLDRTFMRSRISLYSNTMAFIIAWSFFEDSSTFLVSCMGCR